LDLRIRAFDANKEDSRAGELNFEWNCTKFTEKYMQIQLNFTNPLYVSYGGTDYIEVLVKMP